MSQKIDAVQVCKLGAFSIVSVPSTEVSNAYKVKNVVQNEERMCKL